MPSMYSFDALTDFELKRVRQKYSLEHDDQQGTYTLVSASQCYRGLPGAIWPASWAARKARPSLHRLVIAGTLLKAAVEVCEYRTRQNRGLSYSLRATALTVQYQQTRAEFNTQCARASANETNEQLRVIFERRDRESMVNHPSQGIDGSKVQTGLPEYQLLPRTEPSDPPAPELAEDITPEVDVTIEASPGDTVTAAASRALAVRKQHRGESGVEVLLKFNDTVIPVFVRDSVHDIVVRWKNKRELDQNLPKPALEGELTSLLNRYSRENGSHTPDFILAQFLLASLEAFDEATNRRLEWYQIDADVEDIEDER